MSFDFISGYEGLPFVIVAGFFGAAFFMLIELQRGKTSFSEVRYTWSWGQIVLRSLVGMGGAVILYFFFQSDILKGSLWPDLQHLSFENCCQKYVYDNEGNPRKTGEALAVPGKDLALLIVWSFLAGYSQTLVPGILTGAESKATVNAKKNTEEQ